MPINPISTQSTMFEPIDFLKDKSHRPIETYSDFEPGYSPGVTNVVTALYSFPTTICKIKKAWGDREQVGDLSVRLSTITMGFAGSAINLINYVVALSNFLNLNIDKSFPSIVHVLFTIGTVLIAIEGALSMVNLKRLLRFSNRFVPYISGKTIDIDNVMGKLEAVREEYFTLSSKEIKKTVKAQRKKHKNLPLDVQESHLQRAIEKLKERKLSKLASRVRPWLAEEIQGKLPAILDGIKDADPNKRAEAQREALDLAQHLNDQVQKQTLVYMVSLVTLTLSFASLFLTLFTLPMLLPLALSTVLLALVAVRYILHSGMLDEKGWTISLKSCFPEFLQNGFDKVKGYFCTPPPFPPGLKV